MTTTPEHRRAFMDSSGFLALVHPHDAHHDAALTLWARIVEEHWRLWTTNFIVAEAHALFLVRLGQAAASAFLRRMTTTDIAVVRVTAEDEDSARDIVLTYDDKDFSLTDATSFVVMHRIGVPYAFTFDRHFAQYGIQTLVP